MPLFVNTSGEGVVVHATPHRESSALKRSVRLRKLAQYCMWLSLVERGLSSADVASLVDRPLTTVKEGIARARRHMIETGERKAASNVDPLTPAFGCQPFTKARDNSFHIKGQCDLCKARRLDKNGNATQSYDDAGKATNGIDCDGLVCPACGCVTESVQERFNLQLDADDVRASQLAANHAEIAEVPEARYEALQAQLDAEEAAQTVTDGPGFSFDDHTPVAITVSVGV
jgi:hypothetical protein